MGVGRSGKNTISIVCFGGDKKPQNKIVNGNSRAFVPEAKCSGRPTACEFLLPINALSSATPWGVWNHFSFRNGPDDACHRFAGGGWVNDPEDDQVLYSFGGLVRPRSGDNQVSNKLFKYHLGTRHWEVVPVKSSPSARMHHGIAVDPITRQIIVVAGCNQEFVNQDVTRIPLFELGF